MTEVGRAWSYLVPGPYWRRRWVMFASWMLVETQEGCVGRCGAGVASMHGGVRVWVRSTGAEIFRR